MKTSLEVPGLDSVAPNRRRIFSAAVVAFSAGLAGGCNSILGNAVPESTTDAGVRDSGHDSALPTDASSHLHTDAAADATISDAAADAPDAPMLLVDGATLACLDGSVLCDGGCVDEESDNNNCGGCGIVCGGACIPGGCSVVLASGQNQPWAMALDSANVYWTTVAGGTVMKVGLDGGSPVTLAFGQASPKAIAVDSSYVYWTTSSDAGTVMRVLIDGGSTETLALSQPWPFGLAVDSTAVYWTNTTTTGAIMQYPLDGGVAATLVGGQDRPSQIALDTEFIYWTTRSPTSPVVKMRRDGGGGPVTLASTDAASAYVGEGIVLDSNNVYWAYEATGTAAVMSVPLDGGTPLTVAANQNQTYGVAVDGTHVYFADFGNGAAPHRGFIIRVPPDGGDLVTLASGQFANDPVAIAVDDASVYWTGNGPDEDAGGVVMKLTPK